MTLDSNIVSENIKRNGFLLVISSPSGTGKTTISKELLKSDHKLSLSRSTTTRIKREEELDGVDYDFVTEDQFQEMIEHNKFLEHANVFNANYGTPVEPIHTSIEMGQDVLFDIDWQGMLQLKEKLEGSVVSIYIFPPSIAELKNRLIKRGQNTDDEINYRMSKAASELEHWANYDYHIVNYDIPSSVAKIQAILMAERLKRTRQEGLNNFAEQLINDALNS